MILPFFDTRMESFSLLGWIIPFPGIRPGSTIFRYSNWFYHFSVLVRTVIRYSHRFYLYPVVARIILFSCPHTDSTIFRYSPGKFFVTRTDYTRSRYSPGFDHFQVLTLILPFFGTCSNSFSILARILPLPGSRPDSINFRSSHWFYYFWILAWKVFRYSHGLYHFQVHSRIGQFSGSNTDSTIFRYSFGQ